MKRFILIALVVLVVVVGVGLYVFISSLDSVVKAAVEQVGSEATGTQVTLGEVEISPTSGHGALRKFRMTNPQGFAAGDAFKFDEVSVTIDLMTIFSDPVVIDEVVINKPEITYALGKSSSNVDEIRKNAETYAGAGEGGGSSGGGGESGSGPRLVIKNLYLRGGEVAVSAPEITKDTLSAPLPDIHLTDIGEDGRGATPAEVVNQAIAAIAGSVKQAVQSVDVDKLLQNAGEMADEAKKALEGAAGEAGSAADEAGGAAKGAVDEATEGLKKLLE